MADVGVLNLQIQADASQASTSLSALADALTRVKNAVGKGLSFGQLPTQLGKIREALGGNWGGSEQFKTAMTNLKDGANVIAKANVGEKLANDAKGITAWVNAYQKVINTLNSVKKPDTASSKVTSTVNSATSGMAQNASTFSSSMFGGRFAQHFYALNDPDSGYGKVVSDIKTQTEAVSNAVTTSGAKIKDAVSNSTEAMKSGVPADAASGFKEIENTLKQMDAGTVQNIISLASALKELKGVSGIGKQLNDAAVGLNAVLKFDGSNKGTSGTIERIGTALKHFGEKTTDFKVPSFNNLIKLAEALQKGFFASVEIENIAKALEHLKQASDGFVMPNLSGLTKLSSALAGTGVADAKAVAGMQKVGSTVDETVGKMEQLGSVTDTNGVAGQITDLFARLNSPIDYSKLGEFAGQMAGIGQSANVTKQELDVFATDASQKIDSLIQHLKAPVSYKGLKEFVDFSQGGGRSFKSSEQDWEALFKIGEGASSASKQLVAMQQAVDNVTGSYMRLEVAGQQAMYVPRSPEDVKADRDNALSRMQDNQARREAVWSSETSDNMRNAQEQIYAVKWAADQATQSVQNLHNAVNTQNSVNANQMVPNTGAIDGASQSIANYADTIRNVDTVVNSMSSDQARMISETTSLENQINSLADSELMMRDNLVQEIQAGRLDANQIAERAAQIRLLQTEQANLYAQLVEMEHAQRISTRAMNALKGAFQNLREGMSKLPFVGLIKQMMRMARMRALRYMIRELAKGFREGVENVYHYSEAIGGSFHESMDSAATALNQMKNSIGAAVAPAIQALIPLFNTLVGWITTATNYLNQFFSLLSGKSTWTRALPVATKAFDEQKKAAKVASDSVKDMLADFDELNIIQQNGSGGGSGGSGSDTNYAEMFEEVNEYDGKIKDMVQWIEDHMETVKSIAIAIGVAILGWKISKAFDGVLGSLGSIIAGGAMIAIGLQVAYEGAYAYGESGELTTESLLAMAGGALTSTIGGALIGFKIGGPWGALIGGAAGLTLSLYTIIKGIAKGKAEFEDRSRWGDIVTTAEEKQKALDEMFSFATTINVEVINANVETTLAARTKMLTQSALLASNIAAIKADINIGVNPEQDLTTAYTNAMALKNDVQKYLDKTENSLALSIQNVTFKDANGVDISENLLENLKVANTALRSVFEDLGRELAEAYYEGQRTGFKNGEMENMLALMESQQRIIEGGTRQSLQLQAQHARVDILDINWGDMTKEDAGVWAKMLEERFAEYKSTYADPLKKQLETERQGYYDLAGMSKAALVEYENHNAEFFGLSDEEYEERKQSLKDAAEKYENIASNYTDEYINSEVNRLLGLDNLYKEVQQRWAAAFNKNYADIRDDYSGYLTSRDDEGNSWYQYYSSINNYSTDTVQDAVDTLRQLLTDAFPTEIQNMIAQLRDSNQYNVVSFASNAGLAEIYKDLENQWTQQYGTDVAQVMLGEFLRTITKEDAAWMNEILAHVYGLPSPASQKLSSGIMSPFVTGTTGAGWEENNADDRTANATETMQQDITTQNERIDQMNRLLTTMITIMRSGLNVNIAPTSTGGRMVNGMLDAFTRVTGNN